MSDFRPLWVGPLMANAILNFHFDFLTTSLKYNHFLLRVFILFPEKIHLASQAGKIQIRIISVPEIMWPKNGTNMIGFLPESEKTLKIEITCTSVYLVQSLFYLKVGRDTEKPI